MQCRIMRMIAENDRWPGGDVASEKLEREQGRAMSYTAMHDLRLDCYYTRSRRRWMSTFPGHSAQTPHRTARERRRCRRGRQQIRVCRTENVLRRYRGLGDREGKERKKNE